MCEIERQLRKLDPRRTREAGAVGDIEDLDDFAARHVIVKREHHVRTIGKKSGRLLLLECGLERSFVRELLDFVDARNPEHDLVLVDQGGELNRVLADRRFRRTRIWNQRCDRPIVLHQETDASIGQWRERSSQFCGGHIAVDRRAVAAILGWWRIPIGAGWSPCTRGRGKSTMIVESAKAGLGISLDIGTVDTNELVAEVDHEVRDGPRASMRPVRE